MTPAWLRKFFKCNGSSCSLVFLLKKKKKLNLFICIFTAQPFAANVLIQFFERLVLAEGCNHKYQAFWHLLALCAEQKCQTDFNERLHACGLFTVWHRILMFRCLSLTVFKCTNICNLECVIVQGRYQQTYPRVIFILLYMPVLISPSSVPTTCPNSEEFGWRLKWRQFMPSSRLADKLAISFYPERLASYFIYIPFFSKRMWTWDKQARHFSKNELIIPIDR